MTSAEQEEALSDDPLRRCPWPVSWAMLPGRSCEDAVCVDVAQDGEAALFAVFDGHGGRAVADLAARRAPGFFWQHPAWPGEPLEALRGTIRHIHEEARSAGMKGGSTAAMAAVGGGLVSVCNAGDARVVAGLRGGGARRLSVDHKASVKEEAQRIRQCGGFVIRGRLCAMIAVSRGLGDFDFEESGMTCEPHVTSLPLEEVEFLVVASDGLWDIVDDERCCGMVRSWGRRDTLAHRLASGARKGGTDDDVTVIVVWLDGGGGATAASTPVGLPFAAIRGSGTSASASTAANASAAPPSASPPSTSPASVGGGDGATSLGAASDGTAGAGAASASSVGSPASAGAAGAADASAVDAYVDGAADLSSGGALAVVEVTPRPR